MLGFSGKPPREAAALCARACGDLKALENQLLDSFGLLRHDDSDLLDRCLEDVNTCLDSLPQVSRFLAARAGQTETPQPGRTDDDIPRDVEERLRNMPLRGPRTQAEKTRLELEKLYDTLLALLGRGGAREEEREQLYQNLKTVEVCRDRVRSVCKVLEEVDNRLKATVIPVLYGPPPFFMYEK